MRRQFVALADRLRQHRRWLARGTVLLTSILLLAGAAALAAYALHLTQADVPSPFREFVSIGFGVIRLGVLVVQILAFAFVGLLVLGILVNIWEADPAVLAPLAGVVGLIVVVSEILYVIREPDSELWLIIASVGAGIALLALAVLKQTEASSRQKVQISELEARVASLRDDLARSAPDR